MHRRSLPIATPCQVFEPTPERSFCDHCRTHVHDLSAMTQREAEALLAKNTGQQLCIAYRTTSDGTVMHRPEPRLLARASGPLMALGLAACAAHTPDPEHPGDGCRDPQGYEVECERSRRADDPVIPDDRADDAELDPEGEASPTGIPIDLLVPDRMAEVGHGEGHRTVGLVAPAVAVAPTPPSAAPRTTGTFLVTEVVFESLDARELRKAKRAARRERRSR